MKRLTANERAEIVDRVAGGELQKDVAARFGVTQVRVSQLARAAGVSAGKQWRRGRRTAVNASYLNDDGWQAFRYKRGKTPQDWIDYITSFAELEGECLLTRLARDKDGYGVTKTGRKRMRAHRLLFSLLHGPIPPGAVIMHTCDRPSCVNPTHLKIGSVADNNADRTAKGRSARGEANGAYTQPHRRRRGVENGASKLQPDDVLRIRNSSVSAPVLAGELGVSRTLIHHIRRGMVWTHL